MRRVIAVGVIVVIVIAMALLIHSCDASATTNSLKNYNANVSQLITASDQNAEAVLSDLTHGNLTGITKSLATAVQNAATDLRRARGLQTPSQMSAAETSLVYVMYLRQQALRTIAENAQKAANKTTSKDAVYNMSLGTSQLYSSDVIYKTFVARDIAKALNAASIPVGSAAGEQQINPGQVIQDLGWLQSSWIADKIGAQESTAQANANNDQPGNHGHRLNYVTVDGVEIYTTSTNTIPRIHSQTWTLNFTNDGVFPEYAVGCTVKIEGLSDIGTQTVAETRPGETTDCVVHLPSEPTPGTYTVVASIAGVPGENDFQNNRGTYSVSFN